MQTHEGLFTSSSLGPSIPDTAEQGLGPGLELVNKPSCVCIGVGSSVVSRIRNLGHNIWGFVRDPRDLQDPIRRVSCVVNALNFSTFCVHILRALNCTLPVGIPICIGSALA